MTASPLLQVHRRGADGPGELLGTARPLWAGVVQALPPFDAELARRPYAAAELVVVSVDAPTGRDVVGLRPALVSYDEADRIAVDNGLSGLFAPTGDWMVALELEEEVDDPHEHDDDCCWHRRHPGPCRIGDPWWCRIFCVSGSCNPC